MNGRYKDVCKYANTNVVKVSTTAHVNAIKKVLSAKKDTVSISVPKTDFDKKLWAVNESSHTITKK